MERGRRSEDSGNKKWRDNIFKLIALPSYRMPWDRYKRFIFTSDQHTKASLDWREFKSPQSRKSSWTKSHRSVGKIAARKGKAAWLADTHRFLGDWGSRWKEACGSPDRHLMEQTREKCPHILALANTRTTLRAWWEDAGNITRLLLAVAADSLARQGARMSYTITLRTRILLTAQDLHSKGINHGGSSGIRDTRGSR